MNKDALKGIGAIFAGAFVGVLLSTGSDAVMHAFGFFAADRGTMGDGPFALATIYRAVCGVAASYITARLAPNRPMMHALVLGALGFAASIAGAVVMWSKLPELGPKWYPIALIVLALPTAWVGGKLCVMRLRGRAVEAGLHPSDH